MPRIFVDTDDVRAASGDLRRAEREMLSLAWATARVSELGMPPGVAAHVFAESTSIAAGLLGEAAQVSQVAGHLDRSATLAEAADAGGTTGAGLLALIRGALGPLGLAELRARSLYEGATLRFGDAELSAYLSGFSGPRGSLRGESFAGNAWGGRGEAHGFIGTEGGAGVELAYRGLRDRLTVTARSGAWGDASITGKVDSRGLEAHMSADAAIGRQVEINNRVGFDRAYVEDKLTYFSGARGGVQGDAVLRPDHIALKGDAGYFIGKEVAQEREVRLGGISFHEKAGVTVGYGASVHPGFEVSADTINIGLGGKLSEIVGLDVEGDITIHPKEVAHDVQHASQAILHHLHL